jgi:septal ring factor EnvC (AmiA/AmiB activator)
MVRSDKLITIRRDEYEALYAEIAQLRKDLTLTDDVLRWTARSEDELEAEVQRLQEELADAHSAHATVAEMLRQAHEQEPDALDSYEMATMPF